MGKGSPSAWALKSRRVAAQEGDIRPPFLEVWEGRTYGSAPPLRP